MIFKLAVRRFLVILLGVVLLSQAIGYLEAAEKERIRITVLPFVNLNKNSEVDWLGDGFADSLTYGIGQVESLRPIDRFKLAKILESQALKREELFEEKIGAKLGKLLQANIVVQGYFRIIGSEVLLKVRFLDLRTGIADGLLLEELKGEMKDIFDLEEEICYTFLKTFNIPLTPQEKKRLTAVIRSPNSLTAYENYIQGRISSLLSSPEGWEKAISFYERAAKLDQRYTVALYELGQAYLATKNRWKAVTALRKVIEIDPEFAEAHKSMGDILLYSPRRPYDQAIEAYRRAIEIKPHYAEAYAGLGDAHCGLGNFDEAIKNYEKALALAPDNARIHYNLGNILYQERGQYYEAVAEYKKALELDPSYVEVHTTLGEVYEDKGLYEEAIAEYKKAIEIDPLYMGAHYNLALAYEKIDVAKAIAQWERYIELASSMPKEKEWIDLAREHLKKLKGQ